jgi:peptide/nickel transport system permease protein
LRRFLIGRVGGAFATLFISTLIVFFVVRLIPGDPVGVLLERSYSPEIAASLRALYGLDRPIPEQYVTWIRSLVSGNLGFSLITQTPVADEVFARIPRTIYLLVGGVAVGLLIAIPAGIIAATRRGRSADLVIVSATTALMSIPSFWLGILLIILFAVTLRWLPAAGWVDPRQDLAGSIESMILPWLALGFGMSAFIARVLRSSLLDVLGQDYIRTAQSRGLTDRAVVTRHALKNAAIPAVTVIGLEIGYLTGGAIIIEKVFAYPGMGQLIVNSITARDYPMVQASILFFASAFIVVNFMTDVLYSRLDPRIRYG